MANLNYLKNKKIFLMSFIPSGILLILLIFRHIFPVLSELLELLIPIVAIISTFFIPFIVNEIERNKEQLKQNKVYQEIFYDLAELCLLCSEREYQEVEMDVRIFHLSKKIKRFTDQMLELDISYNIGGKSETILIGNDLKIWLNVDDADGRVWGATITLTKEHKWHYDKNKLQSEIYSVLEKLRANHKLEWNKEILNLFKVSARDKELKKI